MNRSVAALILLAVFAFAVASATVSVGYQGGSYYRGYPAYHGYHYGPSYAPYYRGGFSASVGVVPAYSSYAPYYSSPYYYGGAYGPAYYPYQPYASRA